MTIIVYLTIALYMPRSNISCSCCCSTAPHTTILLLLIPVPSVIPVLKII